MSQQQTTVPLNEVAEKVKCNWCRNPLNVANENVTEASFIDTGKTFGDGSQATALYCSQCLADPFRVSQPKAALNRKTLDEIDLDDLNIVEE
jgi:hypothetical protein